MGTKVSDEWTVPLCFLHHRALHDSGAEETRWQVHGADPLAEAKRLWDQSHHGVPQSNTEPSPEKDGALTEAGIRSVPDLDEPTAAVAE